MMNQDIQSGVGDTADQLASRDFVRLPGRQVILAMVGVTLAVFLASSNQTILFAAIPFIMADLGALDQVPWVFHLNSIAYLIAFSAPVLIVGRLTDIYGRRLFFMVGIAISLIGSAFASLSVSVDQFLALRALQGLGAGVIIVSSFIAIADLFPPEERGKFQGFVGAVFGFSLVVGPALGGFVADNLSWNWIFLIPVPVGVLALLLIARFFPARIPGVERRKLDYPGMLTLAVTTALLALSLSVVQYGWASPQDLVLLAIGLSAFGIAFAVIQVRAESPVMPPEIYKNRMVSVTLLATFLTGFGLTWAMASVPFYFSFDGLGNFETSGMAPLIPLTLGIVLGAVLSGQLLSRIGEHYRIHAVVGTGAMLVGAFLIVARIDADTSYVRMVGHIIMGLGLGSTFPTFTLAVQNSVPFRLMGISTSAVHFCRLVGGMLASVTLGVVYTANVNEMSLNPPEGGYYAPAPPSALPGLPGDFDFLEFMRAEAVGDMFILSAAVIALALVVSLFLGAPGFRHGATEAPTT